jgi:hypothetical protein
MTCLGNIVFSNMYLEFRTMDKVQKPSNSECHTASSEPFGLYYLTQQKIPETHFAGDWLGSVAGLDGTGSETQLSNIQPAVWLKEISWNLILSKKFRKN